MPRPNAPPDLSHCTPQSLAAIVASLGGTSGCRYGLAVSGGADSLALLYLAAHAFPGRITAFSVDHRLRPEAAAECAHVATLCQKLGVPHQTLTLDTPPANQAEARTARYALMAKECLQHGANWLLTGHHLDDQAETLLLRLNRGSGLAGLAGIRPTRKLTDHVALMRPLLSFTRAQLREIVTNAGWTPAEDPSNSDPKYDRSHIRQLLARESLLKPSRIARTARHLRDAEEALHWAASEAFRGRASKVDGGWLLNTEALPTEVERRLLLHLFAIFCQSTPDGPALTRFMARLGKNGSANLHGILARRQTDGQLLFTTEPERKTQGKTCPATSGGP